MQVYLNNAFSRFARRNDISAEELCEAVSRAADGLIDARLGGGVIKQRIARKGEGRSGGLRAMILFKEGKRAIFVHGFAKKDVGNIDGSELQALKKLAKVMLAYSEAQIVSAVASGLLLEVRCDGKTIS